jgi:hypothetical protein
MGHAPKDVGRTQTQGMNGCVRRVEGEERVERGGEVGGMADAHRAHRCLVDVGGDASETD